MPSSNWLKLRNVLACELQYQYAVCSEHEDDGAGDDASGDDEDSVPSLSRAHPANSGQCFRRCLCIFRWLKTHGIVFVDNSKPYLPVWVVCH